MSKEYHGEVRILDPKTGGVNIGLMLRDFRDRMHNYKMQQHCPAFRKIELRNGKGCYIDTVAEIVHLLKIKLKDTGDIATKNDFQVALNIINTIPKAAIDYVNENCGNGPDCINRLRKKQSKQ